MFLNRAGVSNLYSHKVRIGNWSEEQELAELRMKEYLHRKEKGELLVHKLQHHMGNALLSVGLSYSPDGLLRVGQHVMVYSVASEGVLSVDPADIVASSEKSFAVTTSTLVKAHVARNTFVVESVGSGREEAAQGSLLKLGQHFRLRLNPKLCNGQAFYLHSQPVSALAASKVSRKQLVCMSPVKSFDTVWKVQWKDISRRFELEGEAVPANAEVVLVHVATNTALSSSKEHTYYNDFGVECEVAGHSHIDIRKSQGLYAELQGKTTTDIPFRKEHVPNHWAFLTASTPEAEEPLLRQEGQQQQQQGQGRGQQAASSSSSSSSAPSAPPSSSFLISRLRESLLTRGFDHVYSFLRSARSMDPSPRSSRLSYSDFRKLLLSHGLTLAREEFDSLMSVLDPYHESSVDYMYFLRLLLGTLAPIRADAVSRVFQKLDPSNSGFVTTAALASAYEPRQEGNVKLGKKKAEDVLRTMVDRFSALSVVGKVSEEDFFTYHSILSTYMESDDYFVDQMEKCWGITH